ncbi:uncharacterized protein BDZ83DRAFT_798066 [Colletotrichum acutatum]|uniref:Uncharacterized protein n=1 Tax=Glomerella acutata TaxID=27357 RepID=A0AAD8U553_GLOAC|nr:uncharacterized protein BDZ83DRAFT_798066 [Colletotrichum acutatum]KAK1704662.1 hypothetical protein BDZ83DRAFT_798066 [Colletotrichum acutatum]
MNFITTMTNRLLTAVGVPRIIDRPLDGWHMNPEKPETVMILTYPPTYTQPPIDHVHEQVLAFKPSLFDSGGEEKPESSDGELRDIWAPEYKVQLGDPDAWTSYFDPLDRQEILPWDKSTAKVINVLGHHIGEHNRVILRIQYEGENDRNAGNVDEVWMRTYYPQLLREYWFRYRWASFKARWAARRAGKHVPRPASDEWWKRAPSNVKHGNLRYRNRFNILTVRPRRLPRIRVRDQIAGLFRRWDDADTIPPR